MSKWHGGKGSSPRPYSVTQEEYDNRWDLIWGRDKTKPATEDSSDTDEDNEENELDDEDVDTEDTE